MKTSKASVGVRLASVISVFFVLLFPLVVAAVPGDEHWDAQFGWPGPGGNTYAIALHNGRLYVSGTGTSNTNTAVQVWDGAQWSTIGQFYGPPITYVTDLAFVGDTLYAGGVFTNVNGVAATCLAKWDGNSWSGVNLNGAVYALAVDGGNLYAAGYFTTNGIGQPMNRIGRWDGSTWSALGDGLGTNFDVVWGLAATNGIVYAGGSFTNAGSVPVNNVARWDGTSWSALGGGLNSSVSSLVVNGTNLYATGLFGSSPYSGVARWDGANWSLVGSGFNAGVQSLAVYSNLIYVAGSFTNIGGVSVSRFAVWNGTNWAAAGSGLSAQGFRVCATGTNVYVGGNFLLAGGLLMNALASWDGANWTSIGTPGRCNGVAQSSIRAVASDGINLYVGGTTFTAIGQTLATRIARFDGANWFPLVSGISGSSTPVVNAIAIDRNNVYVGGSFTSAGRVAVQNIARWDGTNWYAMGNPLGSSVGLVYFITVRTNGVYVAGSGYATSGYGDPFFSRWDGTNWQDMLNFNITNTLDLFYINDSVPGMDVAAFQGTNIFVGGHFIISQDDPTVPPPNEIYTNCNNILRFDGTYANIVGTGLNSNVVAMAVLGTNLYVGGPFTIAGGVTANQIAKWDGNNWYDVGGGVVGNGTVNALTVLGGNLYAGGTFTNMGGVTVSRIAKWNGTNWSTAGSGVSSTINALATSGSDLFAGGSLRIAGGKPSYFIGRWNESANFNTPQLVNPAWLTNRQFRARILGISGVTNIVQASTNLTSWTPILTNSAGIYDFTDPSTPNYRYRFYRAVLGP
jgi:hypothetical protein